MLGGLRQDLWDHPSMYMVSGEGIVGISAVLNPMFPEMCMEFETVKYDSCLGLK